MEQFWLKTYLFWIIFLTILCPYLVDRETVLKSTDSNMQLPHRTYPVPEGKVWNKLNWSLLAVGSMMIMCYADWL